MKEAAALTHLEDRHRGVEVVEPTADHRVAGVGTGEVLDGATRAMPVMGMTKTKGVSVTSTAPVRTAPAPERPGYLESKDAYRTRMRRIEGQVRGVAKMIEDDSYCIDILTQVSAVNKALQAVALGLLDEHMAHCVVDAARTGGPEAVARLQEVHDAMGRLLRT